MSFHQVVLGPDRFPERGYLSGPMLESTMEMPPMEQHFRAFLKQYRAPGPPGSEWTEAHVQRMLATVRQRRRA